MTQTDNQKPIWLDLKKQYIDDNFEALLSYFNRNRNTSNDQFYNITLDLLKDRVEDVLKSISDRPLYTEDVPESELTFNIRLLACYLLTFEEAADRIKVMLAMLTNVAALLPDYSDEIMSLIDKCLRYDQIDKIGITFNDIIEFNKGPFTHKLYNQSKFSGAVSGTRILEGQGRIWQTAKGLTITAPGKRSLEERIETLTFSLDTGTGCRLGTFKGDQLKASDSSSFPKIVEYISSFLNSQEQPLAVVKQKKRLPYAKGDNLVVKVTAIEPDFSVTPIKFDILVETTDSDYTPLQGKIVYNYPFLGVYKTDTLSKYFRKGDYIKVEVINPEEATFSFENSFKDFLVKDTEANYGVGATLYAQLIHDTGSFSNWIAENGAWIATYSPDGFELYDYAKLKITRFETGKNYGKIDADVLELVGQETIIEEKGEPFDTVTIRKYTVEDFISSTPRPADSLIGEEVNTIFNRELIPFIIRNFYIYQRNLPNPVERLKYLANAMALAKFMDDDHSLHYLQFVESYLRAIVNFAVNENIHDIEVPDIEGFADAESIKLRCEILNLLKEYGRPGDSQALKDAIAQNPDEKPLITKLARLIYAANSIRETLTAATLNSLKREIVKNLSIETEDDMEIDSESRPYLGIESQTVEFKTSLVYPPDNNMQPNYRTQSMNIFKCICGFLNSSIGGTLFIGVNDQGYVTGLSQDFKYLKCTNFDTFARLYIIDQLIKLMGKDVMNYVHVDSGYDGEVAIIKVEPFPFGVVELDNVGYIRVDRETRLLTHRVKTQITHEKLLKDKEKADNLQNLRKAKYSRCKVILHDYESSHSGTISDREVEVYQIMPESGLIAAFDCEGKCCKLFSLSRARYVEITDKKWENHSRHHDIPVDAFLMSGAPQYQVSLELDMYAKNLLIEQYPRTKEDITKDANDNNVWYYSAKISGLDALARFYIGLVDHIKIIDSTELRAYIDTYIKNKLLP